MIYIYIYMKFLSIKLKKVLALFIGFVFFILLLNHFVFKSNAAVAGPSYMRCDRMKASTAPGTCLVVFTTSSTTFTEASIKVTLDSEWVSGTNFSTTAGNYTVSTSGIPAGTTAMPGIAAANLVSGNTIRFPITAIANSTTYAFFITGSGLITNPSASTTIVHTLFTRDSGDAITGDIVDVAVPIIADDQIVITATVAPTFTFVLNNNAQNLGTLSSSSVISGSGTTVTVTTNARSGWFAWVKDSNAGLTSAAASKTIATSGTIDASPTTLSTGSEGYVLDVDLTTDAGSGGTVTIDAEYNGATTSAGGTLSSSAFNPIASANGTANGDVITLIPRATIAGTTPAAADYTDTLTLVGAGNF
jgi:hypothetical protein